MGKHLDFGHGLTKADYDDAIRQTFIGQAHIAGTGPEGKTCRECRFWHKWKGDVPHPPGFFSDKHPAKKRQLKPALCNRPILNKAHRLIPHDAGACRLFEPAARPQPTMKPEEN